MSEYVSKLFGQVLIQTKVLTSELFVIMNIDRYFICNINGDFRLNADVAHKIYLRN